MVNDLGRTSELPAGSYYITASVTIFKPNLIVPYALRGFCQPYLMVQESEDSPFEARLLPGKRAFSFSNEEYGRTSLGLVSVATDIGDFLHAYVFLSCTAQASDPTLFNDNVAPAYADYPVVTAWPVAAVHTS